MSGRPLLLRNVRRLTSLEAPTPDDYINVECMRTGHIDLHLSIFEVDESEVTQVAAEFAASFASPGRRCALAIIKSDKLNLEAEKGKTLFVFTQDQHRSIELFDKEALRSVLSTVFPWNNHERHTSAAELRRFVATRVAAGDAEWLAVLEDKKDWKRFATKPEKQIDLPLDAVARNVETSSDMTNAHAASPSDTLLIGQPLRAVDGSFVGESAPLDNPIPDVRSAVADEAGVSGGAAPREDPDRPSGS